jgi:hypothetical protein
MRRALRRAGWGLLAAGALGTTAPVFAREPHGPVVVAPGATAPAAPETAGEPDFQMRLEAVQVELGWLSDPHTFSYQLVAHATAGGVEVRGYVPNDIVRQHALAVARVCTLVPVVDHLKLHPNLVQRLGGGSTEELRQAAAALLAEAFPGRADGLTVQAKPDGEVTVTGTVSSLEEKLAVSRQLRHVGACTCVANHLEVGPVARRTLHRPAMAATAPASRVETPGPSPVAPAGKTVEQASWRQPADLSWGPNSAPVPVASTPPLDSVPPARPVQAAVPPPVPTAPAPAPSSAVTQAVLKNAQPLPPVTPVKAEEPAPREEEAPPASGYVSSGVVLHKGSSLDSAPKPAADQGAAYVSSGTMLVRHHPGHAPSSVPTDALRRRVEAVGGKAVHDVQVIAQGDGKVEVHFKTANAADGDRLTAKIVALPEFQPYEMSFQVELAP